MSASDLRKLSAVDRAERERELRAEVGRMTLRRNARRLDKAHELVVARRELARLLTIQSEAERAAASGEGSGQ